MTASFIAYTGKSSMEHRFIILQVEDSAEYIFFMGKQASQTMYSLFALTSVHLKAEFNLSCIAPASGLLRAMVPAVHS